jgi:hypothetical protein
VFWRARKKVRRYAARGRTILFSPQIEQRAGICDAPHALRPCTLDGRHTLSIQSGHHAVRQSWRYASAFRQVVDLPGPLRIKQ